MPNDNEHLPDEKDQQIRDLLRDYPMPAASAEFFDSALVRATHEGSRRQRNRWIATGFGSAVAAGLAIWMLGTFLLNSPDVPGADPSVPAVTMSLEEPRTINLVFASKEPLDKATLTVSLPSGVELQGFPGQRQVSWQTSLDAGKNRLPLKLIATSPVGGEVLARLEHNDRGRTFRLRVDIG